MGSIALTKRIDALIWLIIFTAGMLLLKHHVAKLVSKAIIRNIKESLDRGNPKTL